MNKTGIICSRCVMDDTDPEISFDANGVCCHCHEYDRSVRLHVHTGTRAANELSTIVSRIKKDGEGKEFDCIIGVSGGVDSTYVAFKVKELGLRPLAVHLDNGWDSELAVKNIENVLKRIGIELYTHVINWEEFKDLQLSFLRASTPDSEIPSDHAIFALMRQMAEKVGVRHIISGCNIKTETHLPRSWSQGHMNWKYIKIVHAKFGKQALKTYPHLSYWDLFKYSYYYNWWNILNYLDYSKTEAMKVIEDKCSWKYYGGKHYESIYTRFYQGYILPQKFGYDKRKSHLSSLICSGEITRSQALIELEKPTYPPHLQAEDRAYVIKKFGLTELEFDEIMHLPTKAMADYYRFPIPYSDKIYKFARACYRFIRDTFSR